MLILLMLFVFYVVDSDLYTGDVDAFDIDVYVEVADVEVYIVVYIVDVDFGVVNLGVDVYVGVDVADVDVDPDVDDVWVHLLSVHTDGSMSVQC